MAIAVYCLERRVKMCWFLDHADTLIAGLGTIIIGIMTWGVYKSQLNIMKKQHDLALFKERFELYQNVKPLLSRILEQSMRIHFINGDVYYGLSNEVRSLKDNEIYFIFNDEKLDCALNEFIESVDEIFAEKSSEKKKVANEKLKEVEKNFRRLISL